VHFNTDPSLVLLVVIPKGFHLKKDTVVLVVWFQLNRAIENLFIILRMDYLFLLLQLFEYIAADVLLEKLVALADGHS